MAKNEGSSDKETKRNHLVNGWTLLRFEICFPIGSWQVFLFSNGVSCVGNRLKPLALCDGVHCLFFVSFFLFNFLRPPS